MSLTARDKKIVMALLPLVALLGYWFLALAPKREELKKLDAEVQQQREARDAAAGGVAAAEQAKVTFASDYATVVRLGKAVPSTVDMPSLLVQLERAARGTKIDFRRVSAGARAAAVQPAAAQAPAAPAGDAAPGGDAAQSTPGQATEEAGEAVQGANGETAGDEALDTTTSQPAGSGGAAPAVPAAPGLDSVPLDFSFRGRFFDLADFFHRLKRFVHLANGDVVVRGRLLTIDSVKMTVGENGRIEASVKATVYLAPQTEGVTAGASPGGPAPVDQPASGSSPTGAAPPAAAAQPAAGATP